jgi:hypothetical protein
LNASVASIAAAGAILASLAVLGKHSYPFIGYRGTMLSALALGVILAIALAFSSPGITGAAPAAAYDNSMDALLSSYSMHWQVR